MEESRMGFAGKQTLNQIERLSAEEAKERGG